MEPFTVLKRPKLANEQLMAEFPESRVERGLVNKLPAPGKMYHVDGERERERERVTAGVATCKRA